MTSIYDAQKGAKRPVTLLELMIVMMLIVLAAGVIGFNTVRMRRDQQFRSGMQVVQQKLQTALETMLIHNENVDVVFERVPEGLKVLIETESDVQKGLGRLLNSSPLVQGIGSFSWDAADGVTTSGKTTLRFSAIAHATPKGTLTFSGYPDIRTTGPLKRTIVLRGYPHPFQVTTGERFEEDALDSEEMYPREIRALWEAKNAN